MHKWFTPGSGYSNPNIKLTTDKEGRIKLGALKKVVAVTTNCSSLGVNRTWFIGNQGGLEGSGTMLTYPNTVDIIEGDESLEFPIALMKNKSRKKFSLIKLWSPQGSSALARVSSEQIVLEDLYDKIELVQKEDKDYSVIRLANLQEGVYKLKLKKLQKTISITVHRGQYWDSDTFILKRDCLFENRAPLKMIKISQVKISDAPDQPKQKVTIQLEDFSNTARVHVFATHFLPSMHSSMFIQLARLLSESGTKTIFPFAQWKNILMSNRDLSDEFRYVFDRKY
jgi:hypothetical protein